MTIPVFIAELARDLTRRLRPDTEVTADFAGWIALPPEDDEPWTPTVPSVLHDTPPPFVPTCHVHGPDCPNLALAREARALEDIRAHAHDLAYASVWRDQEAEDQ